MAPPISQCVSAAAGGAVSSILPVPSSVSLAAAGSAISLAPASFTSSSTSCPRPPFSSAASLAIPSLALLPTILPLPLPGPDNSLVSQGPFSLAIRFSCGTPFLRISHASSSRSSKNLSASLSLVSSSSVFGSARAA
ncbi:unnamed protein product [Closterium sp. Naga37s-1]|nr:unnamed protein product [Closterium sp. Naga37s-1]